MIVRDAAFWAFAVMAIASAVAVIQFPNLLRAALALVATFLSVAGLFVLLNAEFLAVVQVLIYVGAISILIIFAILVTHDVERGNPFNRLQWPALALAAGVMVALGWVVGITDWVTLEETEGVNAVFADTPRHIADLLLQNWVLAFEVASVVLLVAALGALVVMREREP